MRSLLHPTKPGEKMYKELTEKLMAHFKPTPSEIMQRFKFNTRFRKQGESVATFVSEHRALFEFGPMHSRGDVARQTRLWN